MGRLPEPIETMDDGMVSILRTKDPSERLAIADGMWRFAREMIFQVLRKDHPDWDDQRIREEAARRLSHGAI